jgi:MFS family permease
MSQRVVGKRFFYGWVIVAVTFMTSMLTAGITGYGLAFFIVPMSAALGVSRGAFSSITLFRLIVFPVVPFIGRLVDRRQGPRVLIALGGALGGVTLMGTAGVQSLWHFLVLFGVVYGLANTVMGGMVVEPALITKWFVRKRGRAMAIGTMGISTGGFVIAPLVGWLIGAFGWQTAWLVLGAGLGVIIVPLAAFFVVRSPEDMGLLPDGDAPMAEGASGSQPLATMERSWTLGEAMRTRAFWVLLSVQALGFGGLMPIIIHQVAYLQDKGLDTSMAAWIATLVAFFAMAGKLPWGYLAERVHVRWVSAVCAVSAGLFVFLLVGGRDLPAFYAYAVLLGVTMGGFPTLMNLATAVYFGRQHMGAIRGFVTPATQVVGAASPVFAGWMWDRVGSYDLPFTVFAFAWIAAGLLMLLAHPPRPPALLVGEGPAPVVAQA